MRRPIRSLIVLTTLLCAAVIPGEAAGFETHRLSVNGIDGIGDASAAIHTAAHGSAEGNAPSGMSPPAVSAAGTFIAFDSEATNLEQPSAVRGSGVLADTNGVSDVFVHDVRTGLNLRVSLAADGGEANGPSRNPAMSPDGNLIAFESDATDLVEGDVNGSTDIFIRDVRAGTTFLASRALDGGSANGPSRAPSLSEGALVFESDASNLAETYDGSPWSDTNGVTDVFVALGATTENPIIWLLSYGLDGEPANGPSTQPVIGPRGDPVAFASRASNLVWGDTNAAEDVFVRDDVISAPIRLLSLGQNGPANGDSGSPSLGGGDHPFVAFRSDASDLISTDLNGASDIFVRAVPGGPIELLSRGPDHLPARGASWAPAASLDSVAFLSTGFDQQPGALTPSVYVTDLASWRVEPVSMGSMKPNGPSFAPAIGANGVVIAYASDASNLVSDDTNSVRDVFARFDERRCPSGAFESGPASREIHDLEPALGAGGHAAHAVSCALAQHGL